MVSRVTQTKIGKHYAPKKLMYQPTSLGFIKLLLFHLLGSCLGYTVAKGIVYSLFPSGLHGETFPMISQVTQMDIV